MEIEAPPSVVELVRRFESHREAYLGSAYNETRLRREFVDPFFKALGWDIDNERGYAEAYKDVIHEDAIRIGGAHKAPDYAFCIGGRRKFFVEAKKPSVDINRDQGPAQQLRRYAWSSKLPLGIVTDFEELAVYDTRVRPGPKDKATTARLMYLNYSEYVPRWAEISKLFSREAVLRGEFDKYAESTTKRGSTPVDVAFLQDIEAWREELAKNIAVRNPAISGRDLNHVVQMTIDRIVFLRISEDRGIERYGQMLELVESDSVYTVLCGVFEAADAKYNSGLFHFRSEKGRREEADCLSLGLRIDNKPLSDILRGLYPPESPYEFAVIPTEILGQVYERFLGKVIRLTPAHRAVVEPKPELRHARGVYYTPSFIVDAIVAETLGPVLDAKTPKQVQSLKILDLACGSGSFLLGAYDHLLNWYTQWYAQNEPERWLVGKRPVLFERGSNDYQLTTDERKRILLTHLYGVDIDAQAVEVTKLSLLLRVLEGETQQTIQTQLSVFRERALPDLAQNIKWGNSLIDSAFYDGFQLGLMNEDLAYRVNPFDWAKEFPGAFSASRKGFDVIVGNPPYIRIQEMSEWAPEEAAYLKTSYRTAERGNYDIYVVFVEQALRLLSVGGKLGFIIPNKFMSAKYGEALRLLLREGKNASHIVNFGDAQVFQGATTYTSLLFASKNPQSELQVTRVADLASWKRGEEQPTGAFKSGTLPVAEWNFQVGPEAALIGRLSAEKMQLKHVATRIFQGIIPGADKVYALQLLGEAGEVSSCHSRALDEDIQIESRILRRIVGGADVAPFAFRDSDYRVIYPYRTDGESATLIEQSVLKRDYPLAFEYFKRTRGLLEARDRGAAKGPTWYRYIRTQNIALQGLEKLAVPRLVNRLKSAHDDSGAVCLDNVDVGGILIDDKLVGFELLSLLLNSKLLDFVFKRQSVPFRGGFFSANRQYIENLPIRLPSTKKDVSKLEELANNAAWLARAELQIGESGQGELISRQLEAQRTTCDEAVYALYALSDSEIRLIENDYLLTENDDHVELKAEPA
jgi:predicted type IV restriction endonuclease